MTLDQDLEKIAQQEKRLQFKEFDSEVAWAVGSALKAAAEKRGVAVAIEMDINYFRTPCREPRRTTRTGFAANAMSSSAIIVVPTPSA